MGILNIGDHVIVDNSTTSWQLHDHCPYANATLNKSDEVRIPIETQDIYTLPSDSYLYIEGKLTDADNKVSNTLKFANNGIAFLFDEIRYELGGIIIDRVRNPGITCTLKGYASFTNNERYENAGWNHSDTPNITDTKGNFNVCIPLKILLGFAEDFKKIIVNCKQELVLIRSSSDVNAVISTKDTEKPLITLNRLLWKIPHIQVSDAQKLRLLNYIEKNRDLEVPFRSWELHEYPTLQQTQRHTWNVKVTNQMEKPRFIIFGFQTSRRNDITKNNSHFDHCHLTNVRLHLNSQVYPYNNLNLSFTNNQFALLYEMYAKFQESYYYKNASEPCLDMKNFLNSAPIVIIDCSHQNETLKSGGVDVRLEFETEKNVPANTTAYCLLLHDRLIKYNVLTNIVRMY